MSIQGVDGSKYKTTVDILKTPFGELVGKLEVLPEKFTCVRRGTTSLMQRDACADVWKCFTPH